jgi:hypothetical protein
MEREKMKKSTIDKAPEPLEKAADVHTVDEKPPPDKKVDVKQKVIQIADALKKRLAK